MTHGDCERRCLAEPANAVAGEYRFTFEHYVANYLASGEAGGVEIPTLAVGAAACFY
jgi:hypothetical protein